MPEKPASERTEKATPQRLRKARAEGQTAQSQEVPSAIMIAALLVVLAVTSGGLYRWFTSQMRGGLLFQVTGPMETETFAELLGAKCAQGFVVLLPFLLTAAVVSVLGSVLVGGLAFAPKAIRLDLSRISPIKGFKNLVSLRSVVKLLIAIAKLTVFIAIAWHYLGGRMGMLLSLQWSSPVGILCTIGRLVLGLGIRIGAALAAIAGVDFLYQRWNHRRQLRMTRQEVKEERKQHEVSPEVKGRVHAVQLAMARKRMLQDVPGADVVVSNPTHYAVALRYDAKEAAAPMVVAKGADFLCEKIKEIARANGVPVIEKPELARALYAAAEPGEIIPETLFVAVAEILAMIYRLRKRAPALSLDTSG